MGILIAIEGGDGSGKATQSELLTKRLKAAGLNAHKISFPAYAEPSSTLVKMYLAGEFGKNSSDVNAYAASLFYAVDRYATFKKDWGSVYAEDDAIIIADRYTTANALHQVTKLPQEERKAFLDWLYDLEYTKIGLPKPDTVFYLDVRPEVSEKLRRSRESKTHTKPDIHENLAFQQETYKSAHFVVQHGGWTVVPCTNDTGDGMRSVESISDELYAFTVSRLCER